MRESRRRAGGSGIQRLRTSESRRGVFLSDKISQVKDIFRRTGGTLESVLRLVVPGHDRFKRKMENQTFREKSIAAFAFSTFIVGTLLAL